jgi:alginate O-acetyltransferase complex protein AlgJ
MPKSLRIFDNLLILTFIIGLFLPLLTTHNQAVSPIEKRRLVPFPELTWDPKAVQKFPSKFEAFFNDHFGFRDNLAKIHAGLSVILKSSSNPNVLIGLDHWLFYIHPADGNSLEDYRGNDPFTDPELKAWKATLETKYQWLKQRGIQYLFVVAPDKHSIYSEYIPTQIRQVGQQSRLDQLLAYLQDSPVPILDLRPTLRRAKTRGLLYYKTDTHWNDLGAAVAQAEIIRQLAKANPTLTATDYRDEDFALTGHTGDIAAMLNLSAQLQEMAPKLRNPLPLCNPQTLKGRPEDNPLLATFSTQCKPGAPRALIWRDSFFNALYPYISQYFSNSLYVWKNPDFNQLEQYVETYRPNIVIEERVERQLRLPPSLPTPQNQAYRIFSQR